MQENLLFFEIPELDEQFRSGAPTGVNNATSKPESENVEENLRRFMTRVKSRVSGICSKFEVRPSTQARLT